MKQFCIAFNKNIWFTLLVPLLLFAGVTAHGAQYRRIEGVVLSPDSSRIKIRLTGKSPFKVVRIDGREILVAFKNVSISSKYRISGKNDALIDEIGIEKLPNKVVALVIHTRKKVSSASSSWNVKDKSLVVNLVLTDKAPGKQGGGKPLVAKDTRTAQPAKDKKPKDKVPPADSNIPDPLVSGPVNEVEVPPPGFDVKSVASWIPGKYKGTVDDFLTVLSADPCFATGGLVPAVRAAESGLWLKALRISQEYIENNPKGGCLETAYYLRGYVIFKTASPEDKTKYLDALPLVREAMSFYPESSYRAFGMALMGKIFTELGDRVRSLGYFEILYDRYADYPGTPEILYELGRIYDWKGKLDDAVISYRKILSGYPGSQVRSDAMIALGKALFGKNHFVDTLRTLNAVREEYPKKIYEDKDLLLYIGNSYHQIGRTTETREALMKAFNLYPDIESQDIILTRIGDSYVKENQIKKAIKLFRYVTENFEGSDGFIISNMRLAFHLEDRKEKEAIYRMIVNDYQENPLFRLAYMRLADLQFKYKEYPESLETMHDLLAANPRALKRELMSLMERTYEPYFLKLLSEKKYPELLKNFEKDKNYLDEFENANLEYFVGRAYLMAHLYEKAFGSFMASYRLFDIGERPPNLIAELGIAMHETARLDEAVKMYSAYIKEHAKAGRLGEIYRRRGEVRMAQSKYGEAVADFKKALANARTALEKADILEKQGLGYRNAGQPAKIPPLLEEAVGYLAENPAKNRVVIGRIYKEIGEAHSRIKGYKNAVGAFEMSLKFVDATREKVDILFKQGEAYQLLEDYDNAKRVFQSVIDMDDPFWSRLAEEKMRGIDLNLRLKKT